MTFFTITGLFLLAIALAYASVRLTPSRQKVHLKVMTFFAVLASPLTPALVLSAVWHPAQRLGAAAGASAGLALGLAAILSCKFQRDDAGTWQVPSPHVLILFRVFAIVWLFVCLAKAFGCLWTKVPDDSLYAGIAISPLLNLYCLSGPGLLCTYSTLIFIGAVRGARRTKPFTADCPNVRAVREGTTPSS